jgi:hypothetical protein
MTEEQEYSYQGKTLALMDLWALGLLLDYLTDQEDRRTAATKHEKFNNPKTKLKLPPPNPKFIELKNAVEAEIRKKQEISYAINTEYEMLKQDYVNGVTYKSFIDFWETRVRPNTYLVVSNEEEADILRANIKNQAEELYNKFKKDYPNA